LSIALAYSKTPIICIIVDDEHPGSTHIFEGDVAITLEHLIGVPLGFIE